jgi:hypothetical protein
MKYYCYNNNNNNNDAHNSENNDSNVPTLNDIELLKVGRRFRLSPDAKLVVGRNEDENEVLRALATETDMVLEAKDYVGPTCILRTSKSEDMELAKRCASIALRYSDAPKNIESKVIALVGSSKAEIMAMPADTADIEKIRI